MDAIFIVRSFQEKYLTKSKQLFWTFLDLEKTFNLALVVSKEAKSRWMAC